MIFTIRSAAGSLPYKNKCISGFLYKLTDRIIFFELGPVSIVHPVFYWYLVFLLAIRDRNVIAFLNIILKAVGPVRFRR
jgi:hypothetical protein